jgi:hypothetical protein
MQVTLIRENEDGSADFTFDMTDAEKEGLLLYGIMRALENGIKEGLEYKPPIDVCVDGEDDVVNLNLGDKDE